MKFGKRLQKPRARNLIVLDIGTQFLKALFLEVDTEREKGILRNWVKEKIEDDLKKLYSVCQKSINKLEKKTGIKAEQIFLGISRGIVRGTSTTLCYKREKPNQKIDLPELKHLIQKVQWKGFDKIRKKFALETNFPETEVRLVSASIVNIKVDNITIANPLGFQGKNICLTIFNAYTALRWLDVLAKLSSKLGLEWIGLNCPSYALFHCLEADEDVLIIDFGGKITEITLIKNKGELIETRDFDLGGYLFTRTLADFLEIGPDEAETVKLKYSRGEVSFKAERKIEKLFNPRISSWFAGVKIVLEEFLKEHKSLPRKIFLCGGSSKLPGIKRSLEKEGKFKIQFLLPREIDKIENRTRLEDVSCLALANLAIETSGKDEFSASLKRAVKLIQE